MTPPEAPRDCPLDDRAQWRAASPHWTDKRERLLVSKLRRAQAGNGEDPDEDRTWLFDLGASR